jgi:hypothetical protein
MTDVARLTAELKAAKATVKAAKKSKKPKRPMAPHTTGILMERRKDSGAWGVDSAFLRFCGADDAPHAIGTRLDPEDTVGHELVTEIKTYAKEHTVGNSRMRFDVKAGAWKGRADMFPPRLREIAGYTIQAFTKPAKK